MTASRLLNQLQLLLLLVSCWPTVAFSSSTPLFVSRHSRSTNNNIQSLKHNVRSEQLSSQLYLSIPRGGNQPEAKSAAAVATLGLLSPIATVLQSAGSSYSAALVARPVLTKSLTAGLTFFLSDYCAQSIEKPSSEEVEDEGTKKKKKNNVPAASVSTWERNWTRTLVSLAVGLLYFGPAAHAWYEWIFSILPSTSLASTLQKAVLGQCLFGPSFTCVFFATSLMQDGRFTIPNWISKIKSDLPQAFISGAGFWPLVDLISYSFVPVKFIPLFINMCSFVWTIYLSMIANKK